MGDWSMGTQFLLLDEKNYQFFYIEHNLDYQFDYF